MREKRRETITADERKHQRFSYFQDLTINFEGRTEQIKLRPNDISTTGMFINTEYLFPEGSVVYVDFMLAITRHKIHVRGEICYSLPGVGIGVKFLEISPEDKRAIEEEISIASVDPAVAKQ
jgi:c-di-GMP-binding flagellar brake protein YcgR